VALPLLTAYTLARAKPRKHKRLIEKLPALMEQLKESYLASKKK
jgi:hypothetical protein